MKPLATPVLGGMVSSLVHVLIVTPVIFFWLRERQLGLRDEVLPDLPDRVAPRRVLVFGIVALIIVTGVLAVWRMAGRGSPVPGAVVSDSAIVQTVRAGDVEIVLRSPDAALRLGRNSFTIEFRRPETGELLDVGTVRASANMAMPGMVMSSGLEVVASGVPGRYRATAEFGMSGTWQMALEWNGPAGQGSVTFQGSVQ